MTGFSLPVFMRSYARILLTAVFDLTMAALSVLAAFYIRLGDVGIQPYLPQMMYYMPVFAVIAGISFYAFGMYQSLWRYASMPDLLCILKAVTLAEMVFVISIFHVMRLDSFPRSVVVIQWLLLVMATGGARLFYRLLKDHYTASRRSVAAASNQPKPMLIAGTDETADIFIRAATHSFPGRYRIVGILDDSKGSRVGRSMRGIRILGTLDQLGRVIDQLDRAGQRPETIVFSASMFTERQQKFTQFASRAESLGLRLSRLPVLDDLSRQLEQGDISPQPLTIEDLLGRAQHKLEVDSIRQLIAGKRVLITGAGGSIGGELARQVAEFGPQHLTLLDHSEYNLYEIEQDILRKSPTVPYTALLANVRSAERIQAIFAQQKPEVVFHAAALKHVPIVEVNEAEGVMTNVLGTQNVADAAQACGAQAMVLISTDKAVNPTNVMGATKRLAEYYCQALDLALAKAGNDESRCRFMTVRFGNVLGSSGSVVPLFKKQIEMGGPVTVTHPDMQRYIMSIPEAVGLVLQASAHGLKHNEARGEIFVLDMGEPVKILDIAQRMIRLAYPDNSRHIPIVFTGLRPGEKLYEELFTSNETSHRIAVDGIMAAVPRPIELGILRQILGNLKAVAERGERMELRQILVQSVPGYVQDEPKTEAPQVRPASVSEAQ